MDGSSAPDLLTTGEAAKLLHVSRQHVVDLCSRGLLPYTVVGRHRRVAREDVEAVAEGRWRMTADQRRSLLLGHATAAQVLADPPAARELARRNLASMREKGARLSASPWLDAWERLIEGPLLPLLEALTSPSPRARELRQNSPFAGLLTDEQREHVLALSREGYQ